MVVSGVAQITYTLFCKVLAAIFEENNFVKQNGNRRYRSMSNQKRVPDRDQGLFEAC
jgi:hypothetical protein